MDPARAFYAEIRRYWPELPDGDLAPCVQRSAAEAGDSSTPASDFVILGPLQNEVAGLVNLFGIESPGLTSCLAIANEVAARLDMAGKARLV